MLINLPATYDYCCYACILVEKKFSNFNAVYISEDHGRIKRICDISIKHVNITSHAITFAISS
jgi:hypothetical protein